MLRSQLIKLASLVAGLIITTISQTSPAQPNTDWPMPGNTAGETGYESVAVTTFDARGGR